MEQTKIEALDQAITIFASLQDYRDSEKLIEKIKEKRKQINQAMTYYRNNRDLVRSINPAVEFATTSKGDTVLFGAYNQNNKNKKQPLEWNMLAKEGEKYLIIKK